jgi:hypothetical protein
LIPFIHLFNISTQSWHGLNLCLQHYPLKLKLINFIYSLHIYSFFYFRYTVFRFFCSPRSSALRGNRHNYHECYYVHYGKRYVLCCSVLWCNVIWCNVMWYDVMWYDVMWYDMMWYDMMWCDELYCHLFHCTILFCDAFNSFEFNWIELYCDVLYYNVLYCDLSSIVTMICIF